MKIDAKPGRLAKSKSQKSSNARLTKPRPAKLRLLSKPLGKPGASKPASDIFTPQPTLGVASTFKSNGRDVELKVVGQANAIPAITDDHPEPEGPVLDSVVIGGGLSGLTAMYKLGLADKNAKLLEWNDTLGGLAAEATHEGTTYDRGAAYFTWPEGEIMKFYKDVGLGSPKKPAISEPIDSYLYKGQLIEDVWSDASLAKLPPGFKKFKEFMKSLDDGGYIGDQPWEGDPEKVKMFDKISVAELLEPYGPELKEFLDLYCQSALGAKSDKVSAMAFLNFYINELDTRYTFPGGTAGVAMQVAKKIEEKNPGRMESRAFVYDVHNRPDGLVEVRYNKDGKNHALLAKSAIVTTPTNISANIVKDMPQDQKQALEGVEHANYLVHNFFTKDVVYDKGYDTWVPKKSFTDVIVGRWVSTKGYKTKDAKQGEQILTVYQPLPEKYWKSKLDESTVKHLAQRALKDLDGLFPQMLKEQHIEIESSRWPASIHITKPGLITGPVGDMIRKPVGGITFAGMNLGVPAFEEAIYRGIHAAEFATARAADDAEALPKTGT